MEIEDIINTLQNGGIGIMPTDTIYGLVGQPFNPKIVERIYEIKKRPVDKPFVILISGFGDLKKFNVVMDKKTKKKLREIWPNPVTVILNVKDSEHLTRGKESLAFRFPKDQKIQDILKKTGPLIATSPNISDQKPAETIEEARRYFGNKVDFYYDEGKISAEPSTIIRFEGESMEVLRQGEFKI
jgi:L-threonylcarbamoyladenylate synthase